LRNDLCIQPDPRKWQTLKNQLAMSHFPWEPGRDPPYIPWYLCCRDLSGPVWSGITWIHFNTQLVYSCKHEFHLGRLCLNIKTLFTLHTQTSLLNHVFISCTSLPSNG
jgi:hypothetical protein